MDVLKSVLKEELESVLDKKKFYQDGINELPKGSLQVKIIDGQEYVYIAYREGARVKFDFIGKPDDSKVEEYGRRIEKRKRLQENLKLVNRQIKYLRKIINAKSD